MRLATLLLSMRAAVLTVSPKDLKAATENPLDQHTEMKDQP